MSSVRNTLRAARAALKAGEWQRARGLFGQVLAVDAAHLEALSGVGTALARAGAIDEALAWYERALAKYTDSPELSRGLGFALREHGVRLAAQGRLEQATATLERAIEKDPRDWRAHQALGEAYLQDGYLEPARSALEESLRLNAEQARTHVWLSDVHSAGGRREPAEQALRTAIQLEPRLGQAWLRLSHLRRFERDDDADFRRMQKLLEDPKLGSADAEAVEFALGKACDDLGRSDEAFEHLRRAHEIHKTRQPFDTGTLLALMDRIASVCDEAFFERCRGFGSDSELPVFIVGLPRCGSTLVEQIIASHPRAYGVGELRALPRLTADLPVLLRSQTPFPDCLRQIDRETTQRVAARYLDRLKRDAPGDVLRICDKMLSNLLLVGLVAISFPNARVIHVRRQLMDLGLSIYMQSFSGSGVGYAHDLADIGRYHARAEKLMAHWKRVCPVQIIDVEYETLVRSPEPSVRALLDAVGLEFDERCLASHRAERHVRTVSNWQVRQPIHEQSVARWRRYEKHLAPLAEYLDE